MPFARRYVPVGGDTRRIIDPICQFDAARCLTCSPKVRTPAKAPPTTKLRDCQITRLPDYASAKHRGCQNPRLPDRAGAKTRDCQTARPTQVRGTPNQSGEVSPFLVAPFARFGTRGVWQSRGLAVAGFGSRVVWQSRGLAVAQSGSRAVVQSTTIVKY
jgi:hypothetical protein